MAKGQKNRDFAAGYEYLRRKCAQLAANHALVNGARARVLWDLIRERDEPDFAIEPGAACPRHAEFLACPLHHGPTAKVPLNSAFERLALRRRPPAPLCIRTRSHTVFAVVISVRLTVAPRFCLREMDKNCPTSLIFDENYASGMMVGL
jgi:hypothetical protein